MDLAMQRQAVTEWRDRQILAAASLVNLRAAEACEGVEADIASGELRGPMIDATQPAARRIDAHLRRHLVADLEAFWKTAAQELSAIDGRLADVASALREDVVELPHPIEAKPADAKNIADEPSEGRGKPASVSDETWFSRLPSEVKTGAGRALSGAATAAGSAMFENWGAADRLRNAARKRLDDSWLSDRPSERGVLRQIILRVDQFSYAARMALA